MYRYKSTNHVCLQLGYLPHCRPGIRRPTIEDSITPHGVKKRYTSRSRKTRGEHHNRISQSTEGKESSHHREIGGGEESHDSGPMTQIFLCLLIQRGQSNFLVYPVSYICSYRFKTTVYQGMRDLVYYSIKVFAREVFIRRGIGVGGWVCEDRDLNGICCSQADQVV